MLDEREDSINDGYFAGDMTVRHTILDYPASSHDGSSLLSLADGHVETPRWVEATTQPPLVPAEHLSGVPIYTSASDRDMRWLTRRATGKKPGDPESPKAEGRRQRELRQLLARTRQDDLREFPSAARTPVVARASWNSSFRAVALCPALSNPETPEAIARPGRDEIHEAQTAD